MPVPLVDTTPSVMVLTALLVRYEDNPLRGSVLEWVLELLASVPVDATMVPVLPPKITFK